VTTDGANRSYVVVGAGAIGGTLAFYLARAGHDVTVVDVDPEHRAAVADHGLVIERGDERHTQRVGRVMTPDEAPARMDRVLLAVKANNTVDAAAWLADHLADDGYVVSMQNGLNEPVLMEKLGATRVVGAFVDLFADVVRPGTIRDGGAGALAVGEVDGIISERVKDVVSDLQAWGDAVATDNVLGYLWAKLGFGGMLAATALADDAMGDLVDRHRQGLHALAREVFTLAGALGISLEGFDAFEPLAYAPGASELEADEATNRLVAWLQTQTKTRTGVWRDIAVRHRPTEIPAHYAPVLVLAGEQRVAVPVLAAMLAELAEVERDPSSMGEDRLDRLDRVASKAAA
jgi:2-dehydropantoate 2-reductase